MPLKICQSSANTTLADLLTPQLAADPFSTMRASLRRYLGVIEAPNEVRALETALRHFRIHVPADVRRVFLEKREDV